MSSNPSPEMRCLLVAGVFSALLMAFLTATAYADVSGLAEQPGSRSRALSQPTAAPAHKSSQLGEAGIVVQASAVLRIEGRISGGDDGYITMNLAALQALQPYRISTSTIVTDGVLDFDGVLLRDVFDYVGAHGNQVTATALNGYQVEIPMRDFLDFDVLLAWAVDGKPLRADDKGPFWIIYPRDQHDVLQDIRYDYRWVWQLSSLRVH